MIRTAIVFDLDNTLIMTHKRHYHVYQFLVLQTGQKPVSFEEYLTLRVKHSASNAFVLQHVHNLTDEKLLLIWLKYIEAKEYLKYDHRIINLALLRRVGLTHKLAILSLRTRKNNALHQIHKLNLRKIFHRVQFVKHNRAANPKTDALQKLKMQYNIRAYVGDSVEDYYASVAADVPFVGVDTGLMKLPPQIKVYATINHYLETLI